MATVPTRATLDDLYRTEGKAELIGGRIVELMANGLLPGEVSGNVYVSVRADGKALQRGGATAGGVGHAMRELPAGRESVCPDGAYYDGRMPANHLRFVEGPPTFAVEVRSENDYGPAAEAAMAEKREDYF